MSCPACNGIGYTLNDKHAGAGSLDPDQPVTLDLSACYYPTCDATIRPIATLGVLGMFRGVVRHPSDGTIMALNDFTEPAFR